jgi:hypothetical protein
MDEHDWLAEQFEAYRIHLRTVTYQTRRLVTSVGFRSSLL